MESNKIELEGFTIEVHGKPWGLDMDHPTTKAILSSFAEAAKRVQKNTGLPFDRTIAVGFDSPDVPFSLNSYSPGVNPRNNQLVIDPNLLICSQQMGLTRQDIDPDILEIILLHETAHTVYQDQLMPKVFSRWEPILSRIADVQQCLDIIGETDDAKRTFYIEKAKPRILGEIKQAFGTSENFKKWFDELCQVTNETLLPLKTTFVPRTCGSYKNLTDEALASRLYSDMETQKTFAKLASRKGFKCLYKAKKLCKIFDPSKEEAQPPPYTESGSSEAEEEFRSNLEPIALRFNSDLARSLHGEWKSLNYKLMRCSEFIADEYAIRHASKPESFFAMQTFSEKVGDFMRNNHEKFLEDFSSQDATNRQTLQKALASQESEGGSHYTHPSDKARAERAREIIESLSQTRKKDPETRRNWTDRDHINTRAGPSFLSP